MMKPDYGRTTITVPWDLKARMKQARSRVNWSAVACHAFEEKLEELGPIEEVTSIEEAAKRMKGIQDEFSSAKDSASQSGKEAGVHWAMNFARPGQLKRIASFQNENSDKAWRELMISREGWKKLAHCINPSLGVDENRQRKGPKHDSDSFDDFEPNRGRGRHRRRGPGGGGGPNNKKGPKREKDVWKRILDRRPDHPEFFLGFAAGAMEVWDQIKDQF